MGRSWIRKPEYTALSETSFSKDIFEEKDLNHI
jgi:hypothetical protein